MMIKTANKLWSLLADGQAHSSADLASALNVDPVALPRIRAHLPDHVRAQLDCKNHIWQLPRPMAIFRQESFNAFARAEDITLEVIDDARPLNYSLLDQVLSTPPELKTVWIANRHTDIPEDTHNYWPSIPGEAIVFALAWRSRSADHKLLTQALAATCCKVLRHFDMNASIRWPDHLLMNNQEFGRISLLSEKTAEDDFFYIIGLTLSLYPPKDLPNTTGLWQHDTTLAAEMLTKALIHEWLRDVRFYFAHGFANFQANYMQAMNDIGRQVTLDTTPTSHIGLVLGVNPEGQLLIENQGTVEAITEGKLQYIHANNNNYTPTIEQWLLLDCGNSQIKWAWIINRQIVGVFRAPYSRAAPLAEFCRARPGISRIYGSAVCGELKKMQVSSLVSERIQWLPSERTACGIRNHYRNPSEHGSDRWFNVLGARQFSDNACIVVSCGTAVTVDVLTANNHYLGGNILPGLNLMKEALSKQTALLDRPFGKIYPFATTTPNAIASGIMDAVIGAILLMHTRLLEKNPEEPVDIILTGGGAKRIFHYFPPAFLLKHHVKIVDNLVIFGLLQRIISQDQVELSQSPFSLTHLRSE